MSTMAVSGRVEETAKRIADQHIANVGLTANEVIASAWRSIADSGSIPSEAYRDIGDEKRRATANKMMFIRSRATRGNRCLLWSRLTSKVSWLIVISALIGANILLDYCSRIVPKAMLQSR